MAGCANGRTNRRYLLTCIEWVLFDGEPQSRAMRVRQGGAKTLLDVGTDPDIVPLRAQSKAIADGGPKAALQSIFVDHRFAT